MEYLKRIFTLLIGIAMIAGVVYIIFVSQEAQKRYARGEKQPGYSRPQPQDTSFYYPPSRPQEEDTSGTEVEAETPAPPPAPDSIEWKSLPPTENLNFGKLFPPGNPNPIFTRAAERILSAVVTIESQVLFTPPPKDENHKFFWKKHPNPREEPFGKGSGSGIIISSNGYILTNYHVVENATEYRVILFDKREFPARYYGGDPTTDIALLKIDAENLPAACLGNSDSVRIGEWVLAVGSPLNFTSTITAGIVSALGRDIRIINERYGVENFIQTDAVINPGNSGGALVNLKGEVIGINTAIATRTGLYQGYGFAIPSNLARKVVDDLLKYGRVRRALIGVTISPVDNTVAKGVGLPRPMGVLIQSLEPGYPAEQAGLKPGDVILTVDGDTVVSVNDLQIRIAERHPGEEVVLGIWRDKQEQTVHVKLGEAPTERPRTPALAQKGKEHYPDLGMEIRELTQEEKEKFNTEHGIFIEQIEPLSPANNANVLPGEVVVAINDMPIANVDDFHKKLATFKEGDVVKLTLLQRSFGRVETRITFVEVK